MDFRAGNVGSDEGGLLAEALPGRAAPSSTKADLQSLLREEEFVRKVAAAPDAEAALAIIADEAEDAGVVSSEESAALVVAAIAGNNIDLGLSILDAMRKGLNPFRIEKDDQGKAAGQSDWEWGRPGAEIFSSLIRGLALSLRINDSFKTLCDMRHYGILSYNEISFGKLVNCPMCNIALAVVQSHHGIQLCACSKCRYQYKLVSGDVLNIESQSFSMNVSMFKRALRMLHFAKDPVPAAMHSILVKPPGGVIRSYRFFTAAVDLPVQEKERVTVALAAPPETQRKIGFFRISALTPGWQSNEPMSITSHVTGNTTLLLCAPAKDGIRDGYAVSVIFLLTVLWTTDNVTDPLIDPTFPRIIALGAAFAAAFGVAANMFILPQLRKVSQRTVDASALKQQLLMQYDWIQTHLEGLMQAAEEEIRLLAQMSHLQIKMEAVGKVAYSARIKRVSKVREGLNQQLATRLQLIDQYTKISSMIEIEVEMDTHVPAAEAAGAMSNIAEQIQRLMEIEDLHKEWKLQAEARDEVEKLVQSSYVP